MPVRRWGGNSTSRYNWQIDVHNTAGDYFYQNIPDGNGVGLPGGSTANAFIDQDRRTATRTIMTMPLMGWVPKRRLANHPYDCAFKVSKYGAQQSVDPFDTDCGNGIRANGTPITGNDPTDTSVAVGPSFVAGWINHLTGRYGTAANGGVAYYNLDNEPALWNSTHRDVHPQGLTYDELRDRTFQYGAAIKAADPTAKTLGPAEWGWCSYFYSAADPGGCGPGPDRAAHGDLPTVVWYLQQMNAYEQANGVRILDYLDLHFYPQGSGVALQPAGSAATQALRLRSTRALWDPTYEDESYIRDLATGAFIRMVPRMKEWIATHYPGTKTAITEYNWGAPESINGALAQAEVLGIFGREGLDLATLWAPPTAGQPLAYAFRIYRNYDGAGRGFGETSIQATSGNASNLSIFAAQRTSDGALTVMVLNKTTGDLTSNVTLSGANLQASAAVYRYSSASLGSIQHLADQPIASNAFSATFPPNSITLFVIPLAVVADPLGDADDDGIPNGVEPMEGRNPNLKDNDVFGNSRLFGMQQYRDFLGREGDAGGIDFYSNAIDTGTSRAQVIENFFNSPEFDGTVAPVTRLYFAFFNRIPDYPGLQFQVNAYRTGTPLTVIANNFTLSPEFAATYGSLTDSQYVSLLYQNVLGRTPAQSEIDFHVNRLATGSTRGEVMVGFSESPEYKALKFRAVYVTNMYVGMLRRAPEQAGFDFWVGYMTAGNSGQALIEGFLNAPEYRSRFLP